MSSNFMDNLKGLVDFNGKNPHLMATPSDVTKVITPQYSMATPNDIATLTSNNNTISLEQAVNELSKPARGTGKFTINEAGKKVISKAKDVVNLFDNPVGNTLENKVNSSKILNLLKSTARPTSRIGVRGLGPVGAVLGTVETAKDIYNLGKAITDNINENKNFDKQAYEDAQYRQMRRADGITNDEIDAELEQLKAKKAASDIEVNKQQELLNAAQKSYKEALAKRSQEVQSIDDGIIPPPTTPNRSGTMGGDDNNEPNLIAKLQQPRTALDYTDLSGLGNYSLPTGQSMTGGAVGITSDPLAEQFTQDILNNGGVNQQQIMQQLQDNIAKLREVQARDPRYQGEILTPNNPYNINERNLNLARNYADTVAAFRDPQNLPKVMADNAAIMYQQQLANQAGVPYEDYIAATTEARANEINNLAMERENVLKQAAAQATNMKEKIGYMQKAMEVESERLKALEENQIKGQYDIMKQQLANKGTLDVAQTNVGGDIAVEKLKQQDPTRLMGGIAALGDTMNFMPVGRIGQYMYNLPYEVKASMGIQSLTPAQLEALFAKGTSQVANPQARPTWGQTFNEWLNPNNRRQ